MVIIIPVPIVISPASQETTCVECGFAYPVGNRHDCPSHIRRTTDA